MALPSEGGLGGKGKTLPNPTLPPKEQDFVPGAPPAGYDWVQTPVYDDAGVYMGPQWQLVVSHGGYGDRGGATSYASSVEAFDRDLNERIAARQQRLDEIERQEGHADARQKAALAAEKENLLLQIERDKAIAKLDARTKFGIAQMETAAGLRGQDIQYGLGKMGGAIDIRGQDVNRELGLKNIAQNYLSTAAQMAGTDPLRSAAYLLGDKGSGITPMEAALSQMKGIAGATAQGPISMQDLMGQYGPAAPAPIADVMKQYGQPIDMTAAEGVDFTGAVAEPIAAPTGMEPYRRRPYTDDMGQPYRPPTSQPTYTSKDALAAFRAGNAKLGQAILQQVAGLNRPGYGAGRAGGFPMPTRVDPRMARYRGAGIGAEGTVPRDFNILVGDGRPSPEEVVKMDPVTGQLKGIQPVTGAGAYPGMIDRLNPQTGTLGGSVGAQPTYTAKDALAAFRAGDTARGNAILRYVAGLGPAPAAAAPAAAPGPAPATPTEPSAYDTTHNILQNAFYGETPPEGGYDILSGRPLFGTDLIDPKQLAAKFPMLPPDVQKNILSAWGMRNMSPEEAYRRMRTVTPIGLAAGTRFGYG